MVRKQDCCLEVTTGFSQALAILPKFAARPPARTVFDQYASMLAANVVSIFFTRFHSCSAKSTSQRLCSLHEYLNCASPSKSHC